MTKKAIKNFEDKSIRPGDTREEDLRPEEEFFFPGYQVTVRAKSREEAEEKAKQLMNK